LKSFSKRYGHDHHHHADDCGTDGKPDYKAGKGSLLIEGYAFGDEA
jgi:hypothetical protein